VTAGGTTATVTATGLPSGTPFWTYAKVIYNGHYVNGADVDFSTGAPTYTLTTAVSPDDSVLYSGTLTRLLMQTAHR